MIKRHLRLILLIVILVVLFAVSALQGWVTSHGEATQGISEMAIVQSDSPTVADAEVEAMVRQAVALAGGLEDIIEPGDTVVIKPNLVWDARPEFGHVTDPIVTRAVVRLAQEAGAGQVLIRVEACGICRTDLHVVDGELSRPKLPLIAGHQIVGEVEGVGDEVNGSTVGDRVGVPWLGYASLTAIRRLS